VLYHILFVYVCLSFCLKAASFVGLLPVLAACHISFIVVYLKLHWRKKIDQNQSTN